MRLRMLGWATALALLAWVGGLGAGVRERATPAVFAHTLAASQSWQVQVGAESADHAVQVLQFYPAAISVDVGDTITWTNPHP